MTKRILSIILALATILSLCAVGFAAGEEWTTPPSEGGVDEALANPDAYKKTTSGKTGEKGTITWTVSGDTLTFTGTGEMGYPSSDIDLGEDNSPTGYTRFRDEVTKIVVGEGITSISSMGSYKNVKSVSLPSTLTAIYGLPGSERPYSLTIPAGVTRLSDLASVSSVTVDPANTAYSAKDGILYSKDGTTLIEVPGQRYGALTVPEGVKVIGRSAIGWNVTSVTLPSTLTTIEEYAIQASQLENLVVPASVTYIAEGGIDPEGYNTVITILNPDCELGDWAITNYGTETADHGWTSYVTIRGYAGSTVEQYAKDNEMKFEAIGGTPGATVTSGWSQQGGKWYYINADGSKAVGFVSVGGQTYYMNADGVMQTGWIKVSQPYGQWLGYEEDETFYSGVNEYYYYARKDGSLVVHDWVKDGGKWYYMGSNGVMVQAYSGPTYDISEPEYNTTSPGFAYVNGKYYAFDKSGAMYSSCWVKAVETEPIYDYGYYNEDDEYIEGTGDRMGTNTYTTWYYAKKDGSLYSDEWAKIGGKWYWFYEGGAMSDSSERKYYDSENKVLATNVYDSFVFDNGKWYYVDANGVMKTGWVELHGYSRDYCVGEEDGTELSAEQWEAIDAGLEKGGWYYFGKNGDMKIGWQKVGKTWYYMDPTSGLMQTGWLDVGGATYYLKSSGAMATGWIQEGDTWYWAKSSGAIVKGDWQKVGKTWYYMGADGVMLTGMQDIGGATYYLKSSGAMATGWVQVGDAWYYAKSSGALVKNDWQKVGGTWYWFDADGVMAANTTVTIKDVAYNFDASGACTNP